MSENENISTQIEESEELGEKIAEAYDKGFLEKLRKADAKIVKAFNTRYQAINYQHEFGLISSEEYYKKLERARDTYFSRDTQEWHKYTKEINDYRIGALNDYKKSVEKNLAELIDLTRDGKEKLLDYSGSDTGFDTHRTVVEGYWPNGDPLVMVDYTLTDYEKEIDKLKNFNTSSTKLKERAKSIDPEIMKDFLEDMRGMSVEDAKILADLLLNTSDDEFKKHFELYDERNKLAENISASYYLDDYNALAQGIKEELGTVFTELPEDFFEYGHLIGEGFSDAFSKEIESLFTDFLLELPSIAAGSEENNTENSVFSPVYYFFGDRAKTSRTRIQAKDDALYSYMQGMK